MAAPITKKRLLDYCAVSSVGGRIVANALWDLVTPDDIDMDHGGDQEAMTARANERFAQDRRCAGCPKGCW